MRTQKGFSLIETLVVVAVFVLMTAVAFAALDMFQQRYKAESEVLDAFQGARLAVDQIIRDIHSAGYPPGNAMSTDALAAASVSVTSTPFAWSPGYPGAPVVTSGDVHRTRPDFVPRSLESDDRSGEQQRTWKWVALPA
jgi:prepilin-type N-terminal cleavage/methylation domain